MGPLLVYREEVGNGSSGGRTWPTIAVVTYDLGAGRQAASFEVGEVGAFPADLALVGHEVVASFEHTLTVFALNGEEQRVLRRAPPTEGHPYGRLGDFVASPDGSLIALTEYIGPHPLLGSQVVLLDAITGDEVQVVADIREGLGGSESRPLVWREDGRGVVVQIVGNLEGAGRLATIMLDGSIRLHDTSGFTYLTRDGYLAAHGAESLGCMFISGHSLSVTELETGDVKAHVEEPKLALTPREWSPDGTELLYAARPFPQDEEELAECDWPSAEPEWWLLPTNGGPPERIDRPLDAHERWYGEPNVTFHCDGESAAGWYSRLRLMLRAPDDCLSRSDPPARIAYAGEVFGSGHAVWVLGEIAAWPLD